MESIVKYIQSAKQKESLKDDIELFYYFLKKML